MKRIEVLKTYKIYCGGKFPRTESGRYYLALNGEGEPIANMCRGSRKDIRNAVVFARKALGSWSGKTAHFGGQVIAAANQKLHQQALDILKPYSDDK